MATYTKNFNTTCIGALYESIQNNTGIDNNLEQIIQDISAGTSDFIFTGILTAEEQTNLDNILSSWSCPVAGDPDIRSYEFFADQFLNPSTSNWAIPALAPTTVDTINNELLVRRLDDTTEEGIGFQIKTPKLLSKIKFIIRARAQTPPSGGNVGAKIKLYFKEIPNGGVVSSWNSTDLGVVILPVGVTEWSYFTLEITPDLSGLTSDTVYLMEMTRNASDPVDNLLGDLVVLNVEVELS